MCRNQNMKPQINLLSQPISLTNGIHNWILEIKAKVGNQILLNLQSNTDGLDRYIEIAEVAEIKGAYVCCSFYQRDINDALTRMGLFMGAGKGVVAGTLINQNDFTLINYKKLVAGHNLSSVVIREFDQALSKNSDPLRESNASESMFLENFVKKISPFNNKFYVIGFSVQSTKDAQSVVSHEIFHAYYYLNSEYREAVQSFWLNEVSESDRKLITLEIGKAYNIENEDLVIDEFQAYLIQTQAEKDRMKGFVPKYRENLLNKLKKFNPIFV